ncbi:MAG: oligosaccharide flippase family protein [Cryomorphaceae bacterium]|nr:oligosaccharide flippase family protein [Cryomorphaceae bacterium]
MTGWLGNFTALTALRALNVLLPLALYPWLMAQLGAETLGLVIFAQAVATYFMVIPNYSMETFGTKAIADAAQQPEHLWTTTNSLYALKGLLFLASVLAYALLCWLWPFARENALLFLLSLHVVVLEAFLPTWFYQGIQDIKQASYLNGMAKAIAVVWLLFTVRHPHDAFHVPLGYLIGSLFASGMGYLWVQGHTGPLKPWASPWRASQKYLKLGWPFFLTSLNGVLYVYANRILMGYFGMAQVAYYDLAEKWVQIAKAPQQILGLTLFPKITQDAHPKALIRRFAYPSMAFNVLLFLGILWVAPWLVQWMAPGVSAQGQATTIALMRILSFNIVIIGLNNIVVVQRMLALGHEHRIVRFTLETLLIFVAMGVFLYASGYYSMQGLTWIAVLTETYLLLRSWFYLRRHG